MAYRNPYSGGRFSPLNFGHSLRGMSILSQACNKRNCAQCFGPSLSSKAVGKYLYGGILKRDSGGKVLPLASGKMEG